MIRILLLIIAASLYLSTTALAATETRTIPTRPGVTLDILYLAPDRGTGRDALILFPGGNGAGAYKITDEGDAYGWNVLVRNAEQFVKNGMTVVAVAPPSDHPSGMSTGFRESTEHADDIAALCAWLEAQGAERIFFVGNSRGTLSALSLAGRRQSSSVKGVILTSTLEYDNFMRWLPLNKVRLPVLMIHHREDACRVSSFDEALRTREALAAGTMVDFVEINGGAEPMSPPCNDLSSHGFFGRDEAVTRVIIDWVNGYKVPDKVE